MTVFDATLLIFAGAAVGAVLGWYAARAGSSRQFMRGMLEARTKIAALTEKNRNKSTDLTELKALLTHTRHEFQTANRQLMAATEARAEAEGRLERLNAAEAELKEKNSAAQELQATVSRLTARQAELETVIEKERAAATEKEALLKDIRTRMTETFTSISAGTLQESNRAFLDLAGTTLDKYLEAAKSDLAASGKSVEKVLQPMGQSLERYQSYLQQVERLREKAYGGLTQQVSNLMESQNLLHKETGNLVRALRLPQVRGRWGEMTLHRAAELSGMVNRCDFFEQKSAVTESGLLRPDMVIQLPGGRQIVVDAKVPLSAYLDSLEAQTDPETDQCLQRHARQLLDHIQKLAAKSYWKQFQPAPEFVVLFIPGENFFSAALTQSPELLEKAADKGIILATPSTLISLLKTVAYGWRQETASENAKAILELGTELYERLHLLVNHFHNLGREINRLTATYNQVVGSFERRVLTSARKFTTLGITPGTDGNLPQPAPVENTVRPMAKEQHDES
jgi:DNA recombination protein RmuC